MKKSILALFLLVACQTDPNLSPDLRSDNSNVQITPRTKGSTLSGITPRTKGSTLLKGRIVLPLGSKELKLQDFKVRVISGAFQQQVQSNQNGYFGLQSLGADRYTLEAESLHNSNFKLTALVDIPENRKLVKQDISLTSTAIEIFVGHLGQSESPLKDLSLIHYEDYPQIKSKMKRIEAELMPFMSAEMKGPAMENMASVKTVLDQVQQELLGMGLMGHLKEK